MGLTVTVADIAVSRRRLAQRDGFEVFDCVDSAVAAHAHDFLIGCSGRQTVDLKVAARLADGAMAWAVSSQDLTNLVAEAHEANIARIISGTGTEVCVPGGPTVTVLADGHALNLFHAEGVPEPDFHGFENEVVVQILAACAGETLDGVIDADPECGQSLRAGQLLCP
jgi:S-adenosylhomocysteine hydrolase